MVRMLESLPGRSCLERRGRSPGPAACPPSCKAAPAGPMTSPVSDYCFVCGWKNCSVHGITRMPNTPPEISCPLSVVYGLSRLWSPNFEPSSERKAGSDLFALIFIIMGFVPAVANVRSCTSIDMTCGMAQNREGRLLRGQRKRVGRTMASCGLLYICLRRQLHTVSRPKRGLI